ncbi:HD domain-containing phosphohydrolase [Chitinispirillales bacterium ANBcel5]|uniref:HD-GYP domain-containing protein n=1 Tax=Cellulosispirillum alkaliphilum TaxID=3039283 RepID=UPI002A57DEC3|nr:HD domain-containing phosphohydrolase [Chitinispirillales bacterium ANBcel5]
MSKRIVLVGPVSENNCAMFSKAALSLGLSIQHCENLSLGYDESCGDLPAAFISFNLCTKDALLELFRSLPVGFGEKVPYYQCVEKEAEIPSFMKSVPLGGVFKLPLSESAVYTIVLSIARNYDSLQNNRNLIQEIAKLRKQNYRLMQIGTALSYENNLNRLLELILSVSRDISGADAGSIYMYEEIEENGREKPFLRFRISQNDSIAVKQNEEIVFPVNTKSIAGYVAISGKLLSIDDVYDIGNTVPYSFSRDLERRFGYRAKSMLTVPLKNLDGEIVGVLQLMNKKRDGTKSITNADDVPSQVVSFSLSDEDIIQSIASYAAVSIERVSLYESIESIFEGFISSSIAAIDERDRVTSGHSRRVKGYAMAFVEAASNQEGPFSALASSPERVRQFEFAALLHDIGKIGVPEALLTKESRLSAGEMAALIARFEYVRLLLRTNSGKVSWQSQEEIDKDIEFVRMVNGSGYLNDQNFQLLQTIKEKYYITPDGTQHCVFTDTEWRFLSVRAGNLTSDERKVINSHAMSTYRILSKIPWTRQMEQIPFIACCHHEKIDGSGYPHGLCGEEIPLESRILAVVDIYEALVAQDRPYKPKMAPEKAISILRKEVQAGHLDEEIVNFFVEKGIYKIYLNE